MVHRTILAAIVAVLLLPSVAPAQNAAVDSQIQMEAKRKRLIVRPEPPVAAAVRDSEQAAADVAAADIVRESNDQVRSRPQLSYDVTNAIQARNIPRAAPRRGQ